MPAPSKSRAPIVVATTIIAVLTLAVLAVSGHSCLHVSCAERARHEFGITFPNNYIPANGVFISPDGRWIAAKCGPTARVSGAVAMSTVRSPGRWLVAKTLAIRSVADSKRWRSSSAARLSP